MILNPIITLIILLILAVAGAYINIITACNFSEIHGVTNLASKNPELMPNAITKIPNTYINNSFLGKSPAKLPCDQIISMNISEIPTIIKKSSCRQLETIPFHIKYDFLSELISFDDFVASKLIKGYSKEIISLRKILACEIYSYIPTNEHNDMEPSANPQMCEVQAFFKKFSDDVSELSTAYISLLMKSSKFGNQKMNITDFNFVFKFETLVGKKIKFTELEMNQFTSNQCKIIHNFKKTIIDKTKSISYDETLFTFGIDTLNSIKNLVNELELELGLGITDIYNVAFGNFLQYESLNFLYSEGEALNNYLHENLLDYNCKTQAELGCINIIERLLESKENMIRKKFDNNKRSNNRRNLKYINIVKSVFIEIFGAIHSLGLILQQKDSFENFYEGDTEDVNLGSALYHYVVTLKGRYRFLIILINSKNNRRTKKNHEITLAKASAQFNFLLINLRQKILANKN